MATINLGSETLSDKGVSKYYIFWLEIKFEDGNILNLPLRSNEFDKAYEEGKYVTSNRTIGMFFDHAQYYNFRTNTTTQYMSGYKPKTFGAFVQHELELKRKQLYSRLNCRLYKDYKGGNKLLFNYRGVVFDSGEIKIRYGIANSKRCPFKVSMKDISDIKSRDFTNGISNSTEIKDFGDLGEYEYLKDLVLKDIFKN